MCFVSYKVLSTDSSRRCGSLLNPVLQFKISINVTWVSSIFVMVTASCCDAVTIIKSSLQWHVHILIIIRFSMCDCSRTDDGPRGGAFDGGRPARFRAYSLVLWRFLFFWGAFYLIFIKVLSFSECHEGDLLIKLLLSCGSVSSSDIHFLFRTLISFLIACFTLLSNN